MIETLALAALLQVANVKNPTGLEWEPSSDHALVTVYEADILSPAGAVMSTMNLGKPTCATLCTASVNVQPTAFGVGYSMQVRAVAGAAKSDNVPTLNKFDRVPGGPSKVTIK